MSDLLAISIGNTRITCGIFKSGALLETSHFDTVKAAGAARTIAGDLASKMPVALCSVVPHAAEQVKAALAERNIRAFEVTQKGTAHLIKNTYETMGADRIANAVAAHKIYGGEKDVLILDFGTCTTLTAVGSDGTFRGGFITLGLGKTLEALHESTAQLPVTKIGMQDMPQLAFDTTAAIIDGTFLGHIGLIEQWIKLSRKQVGRDATTIATGGWSEVVGRHSTQIDVMDPYLTLRGIYSVAEAAKVPEDRG
jgi:type III pantothenate kinase